MTIYLLLILATIFQAFFATTKINRTAVAVFYWGTWVFIVFLVGYRTLSIGNDTLVYVNAFLRSPFMTIRWSDFFDSRFELGFLLYNRLIYSVTQDYSHFLMAYALPTMLINAYVLAKRSVNPSYSLFLFCTFNYLSRSMSGIRLMMALSLIVLGYHFFREKKFLLFGLMIFLATSFHLSSMLVLPVFFLTWLPLENWHKRLILAISLFLSVSINPILSFLQSIFSKYDYYDVVAGDGAKLTALLNFAIIVLVFLLGEVVREEGQEEDSEYQFLRKIVFYGCMISLIALRVPLFMRFNLIFEYFMILYLPLIISRLESRFLQVFISVFASLGFCAYFFVILYFRPEWNYIVPYQSVLFN